MLGDVENVIRGKGLENSSPSPFSVRKVRQFQTDMTDHELTQNRLIAIDQSSVRVMNAVMDASRQWADDLPLLLPVLRHEGLVKQDRFVLPPPQLSWMSKFSARLVELKAIADDEGLPFSRLSYQSARRFALEMHLASLPSVFLVGNGNIRLVWENERSEQIALQFIDEDKVQFVFFQWADSQVEPIMGTRMISSIIGLINSLGLRHVMSA